MFWDTKGAVSIVFFLQAELALLSAERFQLFINIENQLSKILKQVQDDIRTFWDSLFRNFSFIFIGKFSGLKNRKYLLIELQYLLVGLLLGANGLVNLQQYTGPALVNILIGACLIFIFLYLKIKELRLNNLEIIAMTAEGIGFLVAGYIYFKNGSHYLPYIYYLAGAGYFIAAMVKTRKNLRPI